MQHANGVRYIQVTKHGEIKLKARIFCAGTDALSLCSPTGINGWTYTQKQTTLAVEGFFINPDKQQVEFNAQSLAALDDTCGFYDLKRLGFGCLVSSVIQMIAVLV